MRRLAPKSVASARGSVPNCRSKPNWTIWSGAKAGLVASLPLSSTVSFMDRSRSVSKFHSLPWYVSPKCCGGGGQAPPSDTAFFYCKKGGGKEKGGTLRPPPPRVGFGEPRRFRT